jgi:hypothetical protein
MPGATSVLDPPGFPGGGECTALCKGVVVQKIVQKRGTGKGLAPGWALRQEMCPLGEEGSSAPIGAASLRGGSKQGGGGATRGCGRVACKASTSVLGRAMSSKECLGWWTGQHPMHLLSFEGNLVPSMHANGQSRVKRNKYQARKSLTKVSCRISSLRKVAEEVEGPCETQKNRGSCLPLGWTLVLTCVCTWAIAYFRHLIVDFIPCRVASRLSYFSPQGHSA